VNHKHDEKLSCAYLEALLIYNHFSKFFVIHINDKVSYLTEWKGICETSLPASIGFSLKRVMNLVKLRLFMLWRYTKASFLGLRFVGKTCR
jgi:hypothetical protein